MNVNHVVLLLHIFKMFLRIEFLPFFKLYVVTTILAPGSWAKEKSIGIIHPDRKWFAWHGHLVHLPSPEPMKRETTTRNASDREAVMSNLAPYLVKQRLLKLNRTYAQLIIWEYRGIWKSHVIKTSKNIWLSKHNQRLKKKLKCS